MNKSTFTVDREIKEAEKYKGKYAGRMVVYAIMSLMLLAGTIATYLYTDKKFVVWIMGIITLTLAHFSSLSFIQMVKAGLVLDDLFKERENAIKELKNEHK